MVINVIGIWDWITSANLLDLRVELEQHDRSMEEHHDKKVDVNDLLCVNQLLFSYGFLAVKEEKSVHGVPHETDHVRCECDQKQEKELVVLVTETIVHKRAVMVKALHALVAVVAVTGVLGFQVLADDAGVV